MAGSCCHLIIQKLQSKSDEDPHISAPRGFFCNWNQIAKSRFVRARPEDSKLEIRTELIDEKNVAAAAR